MSADLLARARAWLAEDPDPATRAEVAAVIERGDPAALAEMFAGSLMFGTAGLRGPLGAGPRRMNRVVVQRAAAGLVQYLLDHGAKPGDRVVVGHDARHLSARFAADTAEIITGAGLAALVLPGPHPTPVLAFAIGHLDCVAGVMVTASHNPAGDNGYKVYLGDGCQIVAPADTEIAALIDQVESLRQLPRGGPGVPVPESLFDAYRARVIGLLDPGPRDLAIVYTPLHGVGGPWALSVLAGAGFPAPLVPPAQAEPDPDFPTLAFPNPEEPGALDLALALAEQRRADLVVAHDPDADRCAVAIPGPAGWRVLTGDEVGWLLADALLARGVRGVYATTIVSSRMLAVLAAAYGAESTETLTGFKWIGRVPGLAFGYEEALGYCVDPATVRDKDGISALLLICDIAARAKAQGDTLDDLLDRLARRHGVHATTQVSVRFGDPAAISRTLTRLRERPPVSLGGLRIQSVEDLRIPRGGIPATDGLRYRLETGARVVVRGSGTEPKIKCYLEVIVPVGDADVAAARIAAAGRLDAIALDLRKDAGL